MLIHYLICMDTSMFTIRHQICMKYPQKSNQITFAIFLQHDLCKVYATSLALWKHYVNLLLYYYYIYYLQ